MTVEQCRALCHSSASHPLLTAGSSPAVGRRSRASTSATPPSSSARSGTPDGQAGRGPGISSHPSGPPEPAAYSSIGTSSSSHSSVRALRPTPIQPRQSTLWCSTPSSQRIRGTIANGAMADIVHLNSLHIQHMRSLQTRDFILGASVSRGKGHPFLFEFGECGLRTGF